MGIFLDVLGDLGRNVSKGLDSSIERGFREREQRERDERLQQNALERIQEQARLRSQEREALLTSKAVGENRQLGLGVATPETTESRIGRAIEQGLRGTGGPNPLGVDAVVAPQRFRDDVAVAKANIPKPSTAKSFQAAELAAFTKLHTGQDLNNVEAQHLRARNLRNNEADSPELLAQLKRLKGSGPDVPSDTALGDELGGGVADRQEQIKSRVAELEATDMSDEEIKIVIKDEFPKERTLFQKIDDPFELRATMIDKLIEFFRKQRQGSTPLDRNTVGGVPRQFSRLDSVSPLLPPVGLGTRQPRL